MHFIFDAKLTTRVVTKANDQGDTLTLTTSTQKGLLFLGMLLIVQNPADLLRLVVNPIIFWVISIPGGAGFLPSNGDK